MVIISGHILLRKICWEVSIDWRVVIVSFCTLGRVTPSGGDYFGPHSVTYDLFVNSSKVIVKS